MLLFFRAEHFFCHLVGFMLGKPFSEGSSVLFKMTHSPLLTEKNLFSRPTVLLFSLLFFCLFCSDLFSSRIHALEALSERSSVLIKMAIHPYS